MPENIYPVTMNRFFELPANIREILAKSAEISGASSPLGMALASLPGWVTVVTGNEVRPVTNVGIGVLWWDTRVDQSVAPANMLSIDAWFTGTTEDPPPPSNETFSIDEGEVPTGSWTLGDDGTPYIVFGRGFYKFDSSDPTNGLPTGRVVGADVWIPVGATGIPTEVTFYLFGPDADLASTPVQTKVVSLAGATAGTWHGGNFDTPVAFGADGEVRMVAARFTGAGDAGKYVFGTGTRPNADAILSASGKNFAWAEQSGPLAALSSQFRIGTGSVVTPAEQTQSYGIDIRVDEGA